METPIIYINLQSDEGRRSQMESEFRRLRIQADRFDATRWTDLPFDEQQRYYSDALNKRQFHVPLLSGERGCYVSHIRAWQKLLDSTSPAMVVLEDDVRLHPDFQKIIEKLETAPADWDMIKLIGRSVEKKRVARPLGDGVSIFEFKRIPSLTAGYVISRRGAKKLLDSRIPFGRPIDVDLRHWWENELAVLGVSPCALVLDDASLVSSIGERNGHRDLRVRFGKFWGKVRMTFLNSIHSMRKKAVQS